MQKVCNIYSQHTGPGGELSNFTFHEFVMDGIKFASIEGFLQGLRVENVAGQRKIFLMHGIPAKRESYKHPIKKHKLYYNGVQFDRFSEFYQELLDRAYTECFLQNENFQKAIYDTKDCTYAHAGSEDPFDTILTVSEFIGRLISLRSNHYTFLMNKFGA